MENNKSHISTYKQSIYVLMFLLFMTALSVYVYELELGAYSTMVALIVASFKGAAVMFYFMHLKYEKPIFKIIVAGFFVLFIIIILVTFIDYMGRYPAI